MAIAGAVVELRDGTGERALGKFALIPYISIYGMQGNRIIAVIEGETCRTIEEALHALGRLEEVADVYPAYLADCAGVD